MQYDLSIEIPETMDSLEALGMPPSVSLILDSLGVVMAPTLDIDSTRVDPDAPAPPPPAELQSLGRFQLGRELGRGGMGRVLEAHDPELRRRVAVKIVIDPRKVTEAQLNRFVAEAQITSQLEHPNIPPVYDIGISRDGHVYFVMKKVTGLSLRDVIRDLRKGDTEARETWTRHRLLNVFLQLCNAVAYAHHRGVLHRDLKPDNVMLGLFGEVLLMDWGVAKILKTPDRAAATVERLTLVQTSAGQAIGTPGYMSVEQTLGEVDRLDQRSDIWSLGAILYEILTWRRAYVATTTHQMLKAVCTGPPEDPRQRAPERGVPDELAEIVRGAMESQPGKRPASVEELHDAVRAYLEGSQRQAAARQFLDQAASAWVRYRALGDELDRVNEEVDEVSALIRTGASARRREEELRLRERITRLELDRVVAFEAVVSGCEQALTRHPDNPSGRAMLARAYLARLYEAERSGDDRERQLNEARVRLYDDGRYAAILRGEGAISLGTSPPGAQVTARRYLKQGLVWQLVETRSLGPTPLERVPLEMGSWLLKIEAVGRRETLYPVLIPRGHHWEAMAEPLQLVRTDVPDSLAYVPSGPFRSGDVSADALSVREEWLRGFLIARLPVSVAEYRQFRPDAAPDSAPSMPITGVTWHDAMAFADWRGALDGVEWSLPTQLQWEKAARGVDGRPYPWGDRFDASLCKVRGSRPGAPRMAKVGAYSQDCSPYLVRDMAGSVSEWCADVQVGGDPDARPIRGAAWAEGPRGAFVAVTRAHSAEHADDRVGFRLVRPLP